MSNLSKYSSCSKPGDSSCGETNDAQFRAKHNVRHSASFVARVRETLVNNNTSNEFEKIIAVKHSTMASSLVTQRTPRGVNDGEPKPAHGTISEYSIDRCVKITSPWSTVERITSMAIQFEKIDQEPNFKRSKFAQATKNRKPVPRSGRTKVTTLHIRNWTQESVASVRHIWEICHEAATKYRQEQKLEPLEGGSRTISGMRSSVVDEKTRMRERNRMSKEYALLPRVSRAAGARQTQGQKMIAALASSSAGRPSKGCYSALSRSVSGGNNYAMSLIGSPSLKDFDLELGTKRQQASAPEQRIEEGFNRRTGKSQKAETSAFASPSVRTELEKDLSPIPRKRPSAGQVSSEQQSKRQRFMSQQLKLHMQSAQAVPERKRLRPFVRSPTATAGIANEGNTCYLSAVVQALMNDALLISALRKRVVPDAELSFSSALVSMANDRESSTPLKAGKVRAAISKHFPEFSSSIQQDAHEFFLRCLDIVAGECTFTDFRMSPTHAYYSLIQERMFECTSCGHLTKPRKEILRGLSLDIPHTVSDTDEVGSSELSVKDLVDNFFSSQELDLNCERCSGKKAKSHSKIIVTPRVLVLHIKRFGVQYDTDSRRVSLQKILDPVRILKRFSLNAVLSSDALSPHVIEKSARLNGVTNPTPQQVTPTRIDDLSALYESGKSAEMLDLTKSPENSRSLAVNQTAQLPSPSDLNAECSKRSRPYHEPFNLARRFRIQADEPLKNRKDQDTLAKTLARKPVNRKLELDDDKVEDDTGASPTQVSLNALRRSQALNEIISLGLPKREAEEILQKADYDVTRAVGMAMDRRYEVRENPADLDGDLLNHIHSYQNAPAAPCDRAKEAHYSLAAVIRHHSNSVETGHYVVDVLQRDGAWFCYDDSDVFQLQSRMLQDEEGYLCWYTLGE